MWQLNRAEQKLELQNMLTSNEQQTAIRLTDFDPQDKQDFYGVKVTANLSPLAGYYVLLDNQTYNGEVGYLALQLVRAIDGRNVLLELGFVAAKSSRSDLPDVAWLSQNYNREGRLYTRSTNPLSSNLMLEPTEPARIQNLNTDQLGEYWQLPIESYIFQPRQAQWHYPQPWNPLPMSADKHQGYAFQWFSMAFALAIIAIIWLRKALKSTTKESL